MITPMLRALRRSLLFTATLALVASGFAQTQRIVQDIVHESAALGRSTTYTIVLPVEALNPSGDSSTSRTYPVLYLLHGYEGNHRDWVQKTHLQDLASSRKWIFVLPDGNTDSWWIDSPSLPASRFSTYLTRDLPEEIEKRWPARRDRAGRAIAGLSMGGHGALLTAVLHPEKYASASSLSGILDLRVYPQKWGIPKVLSNASDEVLLAHSFVGNLDGLRSGKSVPALMIDCGTSDTAAIEANRRAHEALTNRAIYHIWQEFPGAHSWKYWDEHLAEHLDFHEKVRAGLDGESTPVPTGPRPSEKWRDAYTTKTLRYETENRETWIPLARNSDVPITSRPIVLLGSSSFEIRDVRSCLPGYPVAYRGISADRLGLGERGLLHRLYCSAIDIKPRAVFILNGTNDLGSLSQPVGPTMDDLMGAYAEIVQRILDGVPGVRIYIVSLSPLRDNYMRLVPKVQPFNERTRLIAERFGDRVRYIDQWTKLQDGQGVLRPEFSRDGLHLNAKGYEHMGQVMREALAADGILPDTTPIHAN